ncbi:hypothetical protein ACFL2V_08395 [Pseudomonadota bacterium]
MDKNCKKCGETFKIAPEDLEFYGRMEVPPPTHCPDCRQQRRLAYRNERQLFKRKCDLCKKDIIATFPDSTTFPVYCQDCWWSDNWDPLEYGQDYDPSRPFFEQFSELLQKVPKCGVLQLKNENSDFNNLLAYSKNTYLSPGSFQLEDCYYVHKSQYCKDCLNSSNLDHCELVSNSVNSKNCYSCNYIFNCSNCNGSDYLADCIGCTDCYMCSGIRNKKYHIKNKSYKKEEYEKQIEEFKKKDPEDLLNEFQEFNKTIPKKYQNQINCENSQGDYIQNCKNAFECYDSFNIEDSAYIIDSVDVKDSMDLSMHDKNIQLCYELSSGGESNYNLRFSFCSCASPNSEYLYSCFYVSNCFGCDSLNKKQKFCILNKQYTEDEYIKLKNEIIEHMKKDEEYGEFFPIEIAVYPYNHTVAQDMFPVTEEEARKKGYNWSDLDKNQQKCDYKLLRDINKTLDSVINEIICCDDCGKNYKIIKPELGLSRKIGQPLSRLCADCRQQKLISLKNPRKLWKRNCDFSKCGTELYSTYAKDRPEKVYCEKHYLESLN